VRLFELDGGKTLINVDQIVTAHKGKNGDEWTLYLTDDKMYVVSKGEMAAIRALQGGTPPGAPVKMVFNGQFSGEVLS
jgi:hypothetical protein